MASANESYDYIIVGGAGSAGCVFVNRLSENAANRMFSLEAGGRYQSLEPYSGGLFQDMEIQSSDPLEYPAIHPNYFSDERDHRVAVGGVKAARRIAEVLSLAPHVIDEYIPGRQFQSDEELLHAARQYSQTIYLPTSTCTG